MKRKGRSAEEDVQEKQSASAELARGNEVEAAVAEIIDAFEQARLVRISYSQPEVQQCMEKIRRSLTLSLRHLAPFAFHAERWLGEEVEKWPAA